MTVFLHLPETVLFSFMFKAMSSRPCKTLFCTVDCTVYSVEFEMRDEMSNSARDSLRTVVSVLQIDLLKLYCDCLFHLNLHSEHRIVPVRITLDEIRVGFPHCDTTMHQ